MSVNTVNIAKRWQEIVELKHIQSELEHHVIGVKISSFDPHKKNDEEFVEYAICRKDGQMLFESKPLVNFVGDYVVVWNQIRSLRPKRKNNKIKEYDNHEIDDCSMCTGPLALANRYKVGLIQSSHNRSWDIHFNLAPYFVEGPLLTCSDLKS